MLVMETRLWCHYMVATCESGSSMQVQGPDGTWKDLLLSQVKLLFCSLRSLAALAPETACDYLV